MARRSDNSFIRQKRSLSLVFLLSGILIIVFIATTMAISEIGFMVGLSISWVTGLVSYLMACGVIISFYRRYSTMILILAIILSVIMIVISCCICGLLYDFSYDGNAYHKAAVASMAQGWNPLQESVSSFRDYFATQKMDHSIWIDHYAQGLWRVCACIYAVTGNIEMSKSPTLFASFAAAIIIGSWIRLRGYKIWQSFLVFFTSLINPIVIAQCATFYCDAFLIIELQVLVTGLAILTLKRSCSNTVLAYMLIISGFIGCVSTKFTGLLYGCVFGIAFFAVYIWNACNHKNYFNGKFVMRIFLSFLMILVASVLVINFSPYFTNVIQHGNPFYPLLGEGSVDIMTSNTPIGYESMLPIERLIRSLLSPVGDGGISDGIPPHLKFPFSIDSSEFAYLAIPDARTSGFGIIYGGIAVIAAIASVIMICISCKKFKSLFVIELAYVIPAILLACFLNESWWARYSGYLYFVNPLLIIFFSKWINENTFAYLRNIKIMFIVAFSLLLFTNALYSIVYNLGNVALRTISMFKIEQEMVDAQHDGKTIYLQLSDEEERCGQLYTLHNKGIVYAIGLPSTLSDDAVSGSYGVFQYIIE